MPEHCKVVFANTGREDDATLDFVQACSRSWNVQITCAGNIDWLMATFETVMPQLVSRNGEPFQALSTASITCPTSKPDTAQKK